MRISPARKSSYEILLKIEKDNAFSSILLSATAESLEKKDRSLCHEIVFGTLRKQLYLDRVIEELTKKKINKFNVEVLVSLRIGIYQLLVLDRIPAYSAINESVNLVKYARKKSAAGLVNAVLRKVSKNNLKFSTDYVDKTEAISVETSHPRWLIEKWIGQFGIEETKKIAESNNSASNYAFRLTRQFYNEATKTRQKILNFIDQNAVSSEILKDSYLAKRFDEDFRELSDLGFIYFQDEGSQLIAESVELQRDENFIDLCASPGSKTTFLAKDSDGRSRNGIFVAGDLYEHRLNSLVRNCQRQGVSFANFARYDAYQALPFKDKSFDVVLVDVPCSGTGTIRNNPEIRYRLSKEDISTLSNKQLTILQNASKVIKSNGRLIYSTCSLEIEENENVIKRFLNENDNFEIVEPKMASKFITSENFVRTFPHKHDMDGFFIAFLVKT